MKRGPKIFGYEPGWLWWAAALVVVGLGVFFSIKLLERKQFNDAYIDELIVHHAQQQGLDVALVRSVVEAESGGDWLAESPVGAKGLMQITEIAQEDVQQRFDIDDGDLYDPDYNLRVGTLYLGYLLERFDGDVRLAVTAYHMGPTAVEEGRDPGPQNRAYVQKVMELYEASSNAE